MPAASVKKQLVTKLLKVAENPDTPANRAKLMKVSIAALKQAIAKAQAQQAAVQTKRKSAPASAKKRAKKGSLPKPLKARAAKLMALIRNGKIAAKQGKTSPGSFEGKTARERYEKFVKLYKGVRKPGKKTAAALAAIYKTITVSNKKPYFLSPGYVVPRHSVGGGKKGQGIVRVLPKSGAKPWSQLTEGQKKAVIAFLNSSQGKLMRSKGAPEKANYDMLVAKKGAASRWW